MTTLTQLFNSIGFDNSEDQMVPESSFDILNTDGGGTVFEPAHKKVLPDFDALLKGIQSGVKDDTLTNNIFMERPAVDVLTNWDLGTQSELSMYEDLPALLPPIKTEKIVEQCCYQPPPPPPDCSLTALLGQEFTDFNMVDELKKKIDYACAILNIPDNPYQWSCEQAQNWVTWTLEQFSLPLYHFEDFQMDGTTLCMLSKADFQARSPLVGEYLFADLDIWKTAYSLSVGVQATTTPEELTYLDLSNSVVNNPHSVSPMLSMTSIPTSVITSSSMNVTSLKATNPNNVLLPRAAPPPISISPALSMDSLASNGSNNSSWTSLQEMEDNADLSREVHHYRETGHVVTATGKHTIHLWQFLKELLLQPHMYQTCIRWMDRSKGIFKIEDSARVAKLWGQRKNRPAMNYDKLSRSIRQYYKKGIIKKTSQSKRLVYQFCPQYL